MLLYSFSFSILSITSILLSNLITPTLAAFSQGSVNLTRDYLIHFEGYSSTESFCKAFRQECVDFNVVLGYHHQLDCVFSQKAPNVRAFCGGVKKDLFGKWTPGETIQGWTPKMIHLVKGASIVSGPITSGSTHPPTSTPSHHKPTSVSDHHPKPTKTSHHHHPKHPKPSHHHHHGNGWGWGWPWIKWHKKEALVAVSDTEVVSPTSTPTVEPTAACDTKVTRRHRHVRNAKRAIKIPE